VQKTKAKCWQSIKQISIFENVCSIAFYFDYQSKWS